MSPEITIWVQPALMPGCGAAVPSASVARSHVRPQLTTIENRCRGWFRVLRKRTPPIVVRTP